MVKREWALGTLLAAAGLAAVQIHCGGGGGGGSSPIASGPPAITAQPKNQAVLTPNTATFTVTATGAAPLTYAWYANGAAIPDANEASYAIAASSAGVTSYTVAVSNSQGSVTSSPAILTARAPLSTTSAQGSFLVANLMENGTYGALVTMTFDGAGSMSGSGSANQAGTIVSSSFSEIPYTVQPDGTLALNPPHDLSMTGFLSSDASHLMLGQFVQGHPPAVAFGVRQGQTTATTADLAGSYQFVDLFLGPGGAVAVTSSGTSVANGDGTGTQTSTVNAGGTIQVLPAAPFTYTVTAAGGLTLTTNGKTYVGGFSPDGEIMVLSMQTAGSMPEVMVAVRQAQDPGAASDLTGQFRYMMLGDKGTNGAIGAVTFDGAGGYWVTGTLNQGGAVSALTPGNGSYSVAASGALTFGGPDHTTYTGGYCQDTCTGLLADVKASEVPLIGILLR